MKFIHLIAFIFIFVFSCKEDKQQSINSTTIAVGKMPALAKDANDNMHVVYGSGDSLLYVYSNDKGNTFSQPVVIDTLQGLVASATRGPQIAATKNFIVVIAVNKEGNIFSYTKAQSGKWLRTAKVNDEAEVDKEGFLGLSSDGDNNLFSIWTDLRGNQRNKIFGARSTDAGATWQKNRLVYASPDSTICECCKPSVAMQGSHVYVMFRNWLQGTRDLYLIQSENAGESFGEAKKLGNGSWKFNACPMDGGGLAIAANAVAQTVWRREDKIYAAQPGEGEKFLGEGKGCTIETISGKNIYAWSDKDENIICVLPNNSQIIVGKGILPLLKFAGDDKVVCIWQQDNRIKKAIIKS